MSLSAIEAGGNFALDELTSQRVDDDAHKALVDRFIDEREAVRQCTELKKTRPGVVGVVRGRNAVGWGCHQARGCGTRIGVVQSDVAVFVGTLEVKQIADRRATLSGTSPRG